MKDVQSRVHIENINKYIKLAPLTWEGGIAMNLRV